MIENTNAELRWRMHFYDLPDYKVDAKKEIAVTQIEMEPLIQTDKAWYTPGQLVRFRILSLNHMLHPILDPVRILINKRDLSVCLSVCGHFGCPG